ncbi:MAG: OmpW family protein [Comamonas sp.]|jgi:outer membrane protein|uniref:OmpW/AlkL family protein n=1 Tax=Comamonas sp. TaxID=34028 RepID=UPI00281BE9D1|nr:OmpW family outer membrane protein [Comamonas sp.]MDR0216213.1 OmpW family protein [Comamonas sp.]
MKLKHLALAAALLAASGGAFAQKAGDNVVSLGWLHSSPQSSSDPLHASKSNVPGLANYLNSRLGNTGVRAGDTDTAGLTFAHFLTDNIAAEATVGVPPKLHLYGSGSLALPGGGSLITAKQWSPALLMKYYFGQPADSWRPFLGIGASYFYYKDAKLTPDAQLWASSSLVGGPGGHTSAKLSNSWAPVFNLGVNFNMDKHWMLALSVSYIPVSTTARLTTIRGPIATYSETKVKLNPVVPSVSLGYRF